MGQKVHPAGLRLGITNTWKSRWLVKKNFKELLLEDLKIRNYISKRLSNAGISKIEIERAGNKVRVMIHTAKPGMIIGRKGTEVEEIKKGLEKITGNKQIMIDPVEIHKPEIDAQLTSENIARFIFQELSLKINGEGCHLSEVEICESENTSVVYFE